MSKSKVENLNVLNVSVTGEDKKEHVVGVPSKLANAAQAMFNNALAQYPEIRAHKDALAALESGPASLGNQMRQHGADCTTFTNGDIAKALSYFVASCAFAEREAVSAADPDGTLKVTVQKLLPNWTQNKSTIQRFLKKGGNLLAVSGEKVVVDGKTIEAGTPSYPTITAVRKALASSKGDTDGAGGKVISEIGMAFDSLKVSAPLTAALADLAKHLGLIDREIYGDAAEIVSTATGQIVALQGARDVEKATPAATAKAAAMRGGSR